MRPSVDLYWLPLGAGGRSVRLNGRIFEAVVARLEKRPASDLYHSALIVNVPEGVFVIEQAPVRDGNGTMRGVVAEGAVGSRWARSLRTFRYENRCWRNGVIPDLDEAIDSPQRLTDDLLLARRVLDLVPTVPTPVWGRDELQTGEMWNSNSLISYLLAQSGLAPEHVHPPHGGRAPGWRAGLVAARRRSLLQDTFGLNSGVPRPESNQRTRFRKRRAVRADHLQTGDFSIVERGCAPVVAQATTDQARAPSRKRASRSVTKKPSLLSSAAGEG